MPGKNEVSMSFNFWNGDEYRGSFAGLEDNQKILMEGNGIYKTADGQIYRGQWEKDSLKKAEQIVFSDGAEFSGNLQEMIIQGPGKYKFRENVQLEGNLLNNQFTDIICLRDPSGRLWKGQKHSEEDVFVLFRPCHSFWQFILTMPTQNEYFYDNFREKEEEEEEEEEEEGGAGGE